MILRVTCTETSIDAEESKMLSCKELHLLELKIFTLQASEMIVHSKWCKVVSLKNIRTPVLEEDLHRSILTK